MKAMKFKNQPELVPDHMDVRDIQLDDGTNVRVFLEMESNGDEMILWGQAYQVDKNGAFIPAPNGYPSRSGSTPHSIHKDDFGKRMFIDDAWCELPVSFDPENPEEGVELVTAKPKDEGTVYGERRYDTTVDKMYVWSEGLASLVTRTKAEDLQQILKSSDVLSGRAFKRKE